MASILLLLQTVHENVHDFKMKSDYSKPKIFTGRVKIDKWKSLSREEKAIALSKDWYVYFSFRHLLV